MTVYIRMALMIFASVTSLVGIQNGAAVAAAGWACIAGIGLGLFIGDIQHDLRYPNDLHKQLEDINRKEAQMAEYGPGIALVNGRVWVSRVCPFCHGISIIDFPGPAIQGIRRWRAGEPIQQALPLLTPAEREQLLTGIHPVCWEASLLPEEDEEDENE